MRSKYINQATHYLILLLKSPLIFILSVIIGAYIGIYHKNLGIFLKPIGDMYLAFLQMGVLPIILVAMVSSIGSLMISKDQTNQISIAKMSFAMVAMMFAVSLLAYTLNEALHSLHIIPTIDKSVITHLLQDDGSLDLSITLGSPLIIKESEHYILQFLSGLIPQNIFYSLSNSFTLQVLFFAIVLGVVLGRLNDQKSRNIIAYSDTIFQAFQKIIQMAIALLPIAMICLLGDRIASAGIDIILASLEFIVYFYLVGMAIYALNFAIVWVKSRRSFLEVLQAHKDPTFTAIITLNSFATLPIIMSKLLDLGFKKQDVELVAPIGVTLGRFGNIIYFTLGSIFIANLYQISLDLNAVMILILGAVFAGLSTAGASGVVTVFLISTVLVPLQIPFETALIILTAIDPIIDPLRTLLITQTNMTYVALVSHKTLD